jgi:hypothetical protein
MTRQVPEKAMPRYVCVGYEYVFKYRGYVAAV